MMDGAKQVGRPESGNVKPCATLIRTRDASLQLSVMHTMIRACAAYRLQPEVGMPSCTAWRYGTARSWRHTGLCEVELDHVDRVYWPLRGGIPNAVQIERSELTVRKRLEKY